MKNKRAMTKSPLALAQVALKVAQKALPTYASPFSKKEFTQPQLFAMLVLRQFFRTDYRGMVQYLADWTDLQEVLHLQKIPHFTTLQKAEQRLIKKGLLPASNAVFSGWLDD
jgi:hypothetical protein